jgi:lipopolysaccharide transport system ATP-binding protein
MSNTVIKVEGLGKQYRLGQVGTGTLSHDINRWWHTIRGKEDPYLKVGEVNDRSKKGSSDLVWAIKDISFEVKQGEVLGLIGRNGAGKSTLLKILSRVTGPTVGSVKAKGRIASLLEVGTGFHPELTGRENIFLNGAILGMDKHEIRSKFDEIVEFSGVERYIDTPVKRYSSGMYVRLAFAVAAHLEPEILIVDEVLAVGDAEFQKKCLGKMKDVSGQGRTVLFVSHNLQAIQSLCTSAILLKNGLLHKSGEVNDVCNEYTGFDDFSKGIFKIGNVSQDAKIDIEEIRLFNQENKLTGNFEFLDDIRIEIDLNCKHTHDGPYIWIMIKSPQGVAFTIACGMMDGYRPKQLKTGLNTIKCTFKKIKLFKNSYTLSMGIRDSNGFNGLTNTVDIAKFNVTTLPSHQGLNGSLADMVSNEVPPLYDNYEWEFEGNIKQEVNLIKLKK